MSLQSFVKIKKPTCKVMILEVFKNSGNVAIKTPDIITEVQKKYDYDKQAPIKTALKKLLADQTVVNTIGSGLTGSMKLNTDKVDENAPKSSKKVQSAKKTTATAKRSLKKVSTQIEKTQKQAKNQTKKPAKPKPRKNCMNDKLYADLCAIGAKDYLVKSNRVKKQCFIGKDGGNCFLSALSLKHMSIDPKNGKKELERVIYTGKCYECHGEIKATVKGLLEQADYGGDVYEDEGGPFNCKTKGCIYEQTGYFVTGLCGGRPELENFGGKFHNHCMDCQGLGTCIGDYRNAHCRWCGKHYFAGSMGQFGHQGCSKSGGGRGFGGRRGGGRNDCSIM